MMLKNTNAMDLFVAKFVARAKNAGVFNAIGADEAMGMAMELSECHYRSVGGSVELLSGFPLEGMPSIEELDQRAMERLKEQDPQYFEQPEVCF